MIQRAQSVYLLAITILMSFLVIWPYAEITLANDHMLLMQSHAVIDYSGDEIMTLYKSTIPVVVLVLITSLISFVNIFLYHHRIKQIRICLVNTILLVTVLIFMFYHYTSISNALTITHHNFRISAIFPMLSIIFNLLAIRAIQHDEMMVRSYNRIR